MRAKMIRRLRRAHDDSKGQVMVIFAAGALALLGMLALAVDVGTMYVERRHAQATADAAALVGAQDWQGVMPNVSLRVPDAVRDARTYALRNGYQTVISAGHGVWSHEVRVDCPPSTGPNAGKPDHIEVTVRKTMAPLFAGIFTDTLTVEARAVARAKQMAMEVATLSLDTGAHSTVSSGTASTMVIGGTYSRGNTKALTGSLHIDGHAYARGTFTGNAIFPTEGFVGEPYSDPPPDLLDPRWVAPVASPQPGISWDSQGSIEQATKDADGWLHIQPGTYDYIKIPSGAKVIFEPGVYHITRSQGVSINGQVHGEGVCFVMDGGASFLCQSQGPAFFSSSPAYNNILIWSADTGQSAIKITGGQDVTFWGTLYAPHGTTRLGGSSYVTVHGQVVSHNILLEGSSGTTVIYDKDYAAELPGPTLVE